MARFIYFSAILGTILSTCISVQVAAQETSANQSDSFISGPYEATWESLKQYETPQWFQDGKLGIFIHWGPYVVPKYLGPFYGYHMYREQTIDIKGNPNPDRVNKVYQHHIEHYGGTQEFGYKDFIPKFHGKNFDAKQWIALFEKAGAKYVVPVAEHCDGFAMYDSNITRWDAVNMGPKRDVVGEIFEAAREKGMKVGMSSHYAYGWYWWGYKEGTDTVDPAFADFYGKPHAITDPHSEEHVNKWFARSMDMMKSYEPDLLWFDLGFSNPEYEEKRKSLLAQYYNQGVKNDQGVVLNYKNISYKPIPDGAAVLDVESGKLDRIREMPWQTDMSLGGWRWSYNDDWQTMPADKLIGDLIDIVSKNGSLLLNVAPDVNGVISQDQVDVLMELGDWLEQNGEGIYQTRPFSVFGQGPTNAKLVLHGNHKDTGYTSRDIRYTRKGQTIYAFVLDWPQEQSSISFNALGSEQHHLIDRIKRVSLLATDKELDWQQDADKLRVSLPNKRPAKYALGIKIELADLPPDVL
ncbi:MAG: alpha-L-fucosidase [Alteromonadaceae bacterium]|uniref:alpha-L-fucosidase n=1 Tax=Paraglaciecola chathamensis TaxID=368405 RepID=UPI000C50D9A3|nr:alpha-L-fucosidase [Paraglaciecola agarilytica]MBN25536.1 alpha-L-fucosidase [Alteromonadaceae bacterium]|tara:strand:+ start:55256 stop:56824 length:1569 start_codon:yes stop_codon:yes gene_type:complete